MEVEEAYLKRVYYNPQHPAGFGGVESIYNATKKDGVRLSRKVIKEWLSKQPTYTLHKPSYKHFERNKVMVNGIDQQWQADLVDMSSLSEYNKGVRYLLTCIDVLSKYAWAVPLKNKSGLAIIAAFKEILTSGRKPHLLQTDKGTEFINKSFQKLLKKENIHFFTTQNETKASVVERFNRTLKTKMWKYFTANNTHIYLKVLPKLLSAYNHSYHRSIKTTPASVTVHNADEVWRTLYGSDVRPTSRTKFKFKVGDTVRISMTTRPFRKGYLPKWTTELFTVSAQIPRHPPVYRLKDYNNELIEGTFYEQELQTVIKMDDVYQVEKVLETRKRGGKTEYLVKWLGYPDKFNSWVTRIHTL